MNWLPHDRILHVIRAGLLFFLCGGVIPLYAEEQSTVTQQIETFLSEQQSLLASIPTMEQAALSAITLANFDAKVTEANDLPELKKKITDLKESLQVALNTRTAQLKTASIVTEITALKHDCFNKQTEPELDALITQATERQTTLTEILKPFALEASITDPLIAQIGSEIEKLKSGVSFAKALLTIKKNTDASPETVSPTMLTNFLKETIQNKQQTIDLLTKAGFDQTTITTHTTEFDDAIAALQKKTEPASLDSTATITSTQTATSEEELVAAPLQETTPITTVTPVTTQTTTSISVAPREAYAEPEKIIPAIATATPPSSSNSITLNKVITAPQVLPTLTWDFPALTPSTSIAQGFTLTITLDMTNYETYGAVLLGFGTSDNSVKTRLIQPMINQSTGKLEELTREGFAGAQYTIMLYGTGDSLSVYLTSAQQTAIISNAIVDLPGVTDLKTMPILLHLTSQPNGPLFDIKVAPAHSTPDWNTIASVWSWTPQTQQAEAFSRIGVNSFNTQISLRDVTLTPLTSSPERQSATQNTATPASTTEVSTSSQATEQQNTTTIAPETPAQPAPVDVTIKTTPGLRSITWDTTPLQTALTPDGGGSISTSVPFTTAGTSAIIALTSAAPSVTIKPATYRIVIYPNAFAQNALLYINSTATPGTLTDAGRQQLTTLLPAQATELPASHTLWALYIPTDAGRTFYVGIDTEIKKQNAIWSFTDTQPADTAPLTQFGLGSLSNELFFSNTKVTPLEKATTENTESPTASTILTTPGNIIWDHPLLATSLDEHGGGTFAGSFSFNGLGNEIIFGLTNDQKTPVYRIMINPLSPQGAYVSLKKDLNESLLGVNQQIPIEISKPQNIWVVYKQLAFEGNKQKQRSIKVYLNTPPVQETETAIWSFNETVDTKAPDPLFFGLGSRLQPITIKSITVTPQAISEQEKAKAQEQQTAQALLTERKDLDANDFPLAEQWTKNSGLNVRQMNKGTRITFKARGNDDDKMVLAFAQNRTGTPVNFRVILNAKGTIITDAATPITKDTPAASPFGKLSPALQSYWIEIDAQNKIKIGLEADQTTPYLQWQNSNTQTANNTWYFVSAGTDGTDIESNAALNTALATTQSATTRVVRGIARRYSA